MMDTFLDWEVPPLAIVADKAYGSAKIRQQIADEGALAVIPSKSNARQPIPHDVNLYRKRNIVERFFCKMKDMRRLATRFEKKAQNFLSMVQLFAIRCWINWVHTLVISGEHICVDHIATVQSILRSSGFRPNAKKTYFAKNPKQNIITGLSISTGVVKVRKSFKRLVRAEVYAVEKFGLVAASKRGKSFDPLFIERLIGKLNWWQNIEPENSYPKTHLTKIANLLKNHDLSHRVGPPKMGQKIKAD